METLSPAQDDSSGANPSSVKSDDNTCNESGRSSPPPKCAICLGVCRNKSFTDSCLHQFCFKCLLTWSKVKAECPLCKQNFRSIIHNVQSNHQYEEYMVEQRQVEEVAERIELDNFGSSSRRFRFRTTLTLPRRETLAIQQLLMHYPLMSDVFPPPAQRRRSPAAFRRTVYRYNLWARPLPDFTGRFRDCTPEFYRYNDSQMHRLVPWLDRELHYLLNENVGHVSYVISQILDMLPQHHINSSEFRDVLMRYFGDRTEHFLHELYCFASTPYDMTGYDRNVQYTTDTRVSTMINEIVSSSESEATVDSDIVMISSSEPNDAPPGPSNAAAHVPGPVYPRNYISPPRSNVIPIETISHSDTDDDDSEVMVVGYIKPPQDRTPEVVDLLGSDSDVVVQESVPPEPGPSQTADASAAGLVKIELRQAQRPQTETDDSDDTYTPPQARRSRGGASGSSASRRSAAARRRAGASHTDTDSEASGYTPPPRTSARSSLSNSAASVTNSADSTASSARSATSSERSADSSACASGASLNMRPSSSVTQSSLPPPLTWNSDSWSSDSNDRTYSTDSDDDSSKKKRRRYRVKIPIGERRRIRLERQYRMGRHEIKVVQDSSEKKSQSKKRGKPPKKSAEITSPGTPPIRPVTTIDQPGPSGSRQNKRRLNNDAGHGRETKRLKSVVNIVNSSKNEDSPSNAKCSSSVKSSQVTMNKKAQCKSNSPRSLATAETDDSDSEDNLPLNLTVAHSSSSRHSSSQISQQTN